MIDQINEDKSLSTTTGETFGPFDYLIAAPGRFGMVWLSEQVEKLGLKSSYESIDIGVRVEVKSEILDEICTIQRDPKFHIFTKTHDDMVRTFCTNHEGYVVLEAYNDATIGVNGVWYMNRKSDNSNFAFLNRVNLTEPLEDSTRFGKAIANIATTLGGGKPIVQRLRDLRRGVRTTEKRLRKSNVIPTLPFDAITPGDVTLAYPGRIMQNIVEGLEQLDKVIPGVASDSTPALCPGDQVQRQADKDKPRSRDGHRWLLRGGGWRGPEQGHRGRSGDRADRCQVDQGKTWPGRGLKENSRSIHFSSLCCGFGENRFKWV